MAAIADARSPKRAAQLSAAIISSSLHHCEVPRRKRSNVLEPSGVLFATALHTYPIAGVNSLRGKQKSRSFLTAARQSISAGDV